jgi:hypothetical protein
LTPSAPWSEHLNVILTVVVSFKVNCVCRKHAATPGYSTVHLQSGSASDEIPGCCTGSHCHPRNTGTILSDCTRALRPTACAGSYLAPIAALPRQPNQRVSHESRTQQRRGAQQDSRLVRTSESAPPPSCVGISDLCCPRALMQGGDCLEEYARLLLVLLLRASGALGASGRGPASAHDAPTGAALARVCAESEDG